MENTSENKQKKKRRGNIILALSLSLSIVATGALVAYYFLNANKNGVNSANDIKGLKIKD
ncbi:hypothetical protein ACWXVM_02430 [Mycoplasma sp. 2261]